MVKDKKMIDTLIGSKCQMGQTFVKGTRVPFTRIKVGPCVVVQIKTEKRDGYHAIQVGFGEKSVQKMTKQIQGHIRGVKDKTKAPRFLREIRLERKSELKVGDVLKVEDVFKRGDEVSITGVSKGKGFAGVVKRWGFRGGPKTHGQSDRQRAPGSIGLGTTPGRVFKGKKMAGRMGGETTKIINMIVIEVDEKRDEILVSGPVPGNRNTLLRIDKTASGKLEELLSEAPQVQVQGEEEEKDNKEGGEEVQSKPAVEEEKNE